MASNLPKLNSIISSLLNGLIGRRNIARIVAMAVVFCFSLAMGYDGPFEFGSKVSPGDSDISRMLYGFPCMANPNVAFRDIGLMTGTYDEGDAIYLDVTDDRMVSLNDVRLTPFGNKAAGTKVMLEDNDLGAVLLPLTNWMIVCRDSGSYRGYCFEDSIYLHNASRGNTTVPGDARLIGFSGLAAGTKVKAFNRDCYVLVKPLIAKFPAPTWGNSAATIRFYNPNGNYDENGKPVYDSPDTVYLDISLQGPMPPSVESFGFVAVDDVRLST